MSTNHHTPIVDNAPNRASTFNAPLAQLDAAIDAIPAGTTFSILSVGGPVSVIIASGAIAMTTSHHQLITEGGGLTDDLDSITGGSTGYILFLKNFYTGYTITVRHNVGNIFLNARRNYSLATTGMLALMYDGNWWRDFGMMSTGSILETQIFS